MRKKSKATKAAEYDALELECNVYKRMTTILFHNTGPNAITYDDREIVRDDNPSRLKPIEYRLYDSLRANGGILVTLVWTDDGSAIVLAELFDSWYSRMSQLQYSGGFNTEIRIACDKLFAKRTKLIANRCEAEQRSSLYGMRRL